MFMIDTRGKLLYPGYYSLIQLSLLSLSPFNSENIKLEFILDIYQEKSQNREIIAAQMGKDTENVGNFTEQIITSIQ